MDNSGRDELQHPDTDADLPAIPDTPAGRRLAAYLDVFNRGGGIGLLRDFIAGHYAQATLNKTSADRRAATPRSRISCASIVPCAQTSSCARTQLSCS
jgi:hypothetical protein